MMNNMRNPYWEKAIQYQQRGNPGKPQQHRPQPSQNQGQRPRGVGDQPRLTKSLDLLYLNKPGIIHFIDGTTIEGTVTRYTMYWLEVKLNDGRHIYVNKGSIKFIEIKEEGEGNKPAGGGQHDNSKLGKL